MASYKHAHTFNYPWDQVTRAVWQKYPNPYSSHVLSADVVDRHVDPETGFLHTTRILLKKGVIPSWGRALFRVQEAYVIEQSVVDPRARSMTVVTRNLNHKKLLLVEEQQVITPSRNATTVAGGQIQDLPVSTTVAITNRIRSNYGWAAFRSKIESFGLARVKSHAITSSKALLHSLERLCAPGSSSS